MKGFNPRLLQPRAQADLCPSQERAFFLGGAGYQCFPSQLPITEAKFLVSMVKRWELPSLTQTPQVEWRFYPGFSTLRILVSWYSGSMPRKASQEDVRLLPLAHSLHQEPSYYARTLPFFPCTAPELWLKDSAEGVEV